MEFHRPPHTFIGQVDIKVSNLERSLLFYQNIIGFKVLEQSENKALLTADGKTALLSIEQPEDIIPKEPRTTGLYHFAILLPTRADLGRILLHFIQNDIPLGASDHLVSEALYLNDPDGNGIEVYADRDSSTWEWQNNEVTMTTETLDGQSVIEEGRGEAWTGLPTNTLMGHIHLHVSELSRTEEFYTKALGFDVVTRYGGQALFISTGGYHHHIGLNTWNGIGAPAPSENSVGLKWFSLVLPNEEARKTTIDKLKSMGVWVQEDGGEILTKDPSGNKIKLVIA
ncbi:VOC family protein [Ferdinandcohnia quinoae]|uniref:VOC family protein n=1 Tax=Fredinandcohnia quinoae TaxID=2918902 RepID=A0AAW5E4P4_9BACI|nr:VOC family protein [Fredinandcohnia sp. SECRCQ15]MCH1627901.1 VOC family protein [Fredinandcohnia sp. SECRCQ15]